VLEPKHRGQRLAYVLDLDHVDELSRVAAGRRAPLAADPLKPGRTPGDHRTAEPHPLRLGQAPRQARDAAHLAGQTDLADGHDAAWHGQARHRAGQRDGDGQVDRGLGQPHAAHGRRVHVLLAELEPGPALQHREHHAHPRAVQARRSAAGHLQCGGRDQSLYLRGQRPSALQRDRDAGARHRLAVLGQEQPARIGQPDEAVLTEVEAADLVGRPEPVLHRPHHAQLGVPVAVEMQHDVDKVLQRPRARDRTVLGDVPDQDGGQRPLLREAGQDVRHRPHLGDTAGRPVDPVGGDRLHRVDDEQPGIHLVDVSKHRVEIGLGGQEEPFADRADPVRPGAHLGGGLLPGDVQHRARLSDQRARLEQQGRLAHPGLARQQQDRARHQPAT
jgi:hypothetical protein